MSQGTQRANTKRIYHVSAKDLPLSCPTKDMRVWDAHPKVYLPIEASGKAVSLCMCFAHVVSNLRLRSSC